MQLRIPIYEIKYDDMNLILPNFASVIVQYFYSVECCEILCDLFDLL